MKVLLRLQLIFILCRLISHLSEYTAKPNPELREQPSLATECGFIAVWMPPGIDVYPYIQVGLGAQQHRGQESAGAAIYTPGGTFWTEAQMGLVSQVLGDDKFQPGNVGLGHARYSTTGDSTNVNAQPFTYEQNGFGLSGAHNGNFFEATPLREQVKNAPAASSDTAYALRYLLEMRARYPNWAEALKAGYGELSNYGSFCMANVTEDGSLFAASDTHGNRPSALSRFPDGGWLLSSESIAADKLGAEYLRPLLPGELVQITPEGELISHFFGEAAQQQPCLLERVYFMRPDNWDGNVRVRTGRRESGRRAAGRMKEMGRDVDVVVPVLDSGDLFAQGLSEGLDVGIEKALTRDHYIGRTFIQPGNHNRRNSINLKHNPTPDGIAGNRVVAGDDSLVRGNTIAKIGAAIESVGADEVHGAFGSPPIVNGCDLGVAIESDLPATAYKDEPLEVIEEQIARKTGLKSVTYTPIKDVTAAFGGTPETFCYHCMGGPHPVRDHEANWPQKERPINGSPNISVFASGGGTNLEAILRAIESGKLDVKVTNVVSNNPQAYALQRAQSRGISIDTIPSQGQLKGDKRKDYNQRLIEHLEATMPDALVLAGWMVVLDDELLERMENLEIPIINLHPALLTPDNAERINTSRGQIPILRGIHAIQDAYNLNLPVSGVTVHQLIPGTHFDTGPIVYREEVKRRKTDTPEQWEARIHEAEYRALPTAISRLSHVMKQNIDVSKGTYPW